MPHPRKIVPVKFRQKLGKLIREYRVLNTVSATIAADTLGITHQCLCDYESGKCSPSAYILIRMVDLLAVDRAELLSCLEETDLYGIPENTERTEIGGGFQSPLDSRKGTNVCARTTERMGWGQPIIDME